MNIKIKVYLNKARRGNMTKLNNLFSLSNSLDSFLESWDSNFYTYTISTYPNYPQDVQLPSYPKSNGYLLENGTFILELACTGFEKDEVIVKANDSNLIIEGNKKEKDKEETILFKNFPIKDFKWERKVSNRYDMNSLDVTLKNGVLSIIIPLKEEAKPVKKEFTIK